MNKKNAGYLIFLAASIIEMLFLLFIETRRNSLEVFFDQGNPIAVVVYSAVIMGCHILVFHLLSFLKHIGVRISITLLSAPFVFVLMMFLYSLLTDRLGII